jgi:Ca2+-binding EF-hand superfamily protein
MFKAMNVDGDCYVSSAEFHQHMGERANQQAFSHLKMDTAKLIAMLDTDADGKISVNEFVQGLTSR